VGEKMSNAEATPLTFADFEAAGWCAIVEGSSKKTCLHYAELFQQKFGEAEKAGEAVSARVYRLLMDIGYIVLDPRSVDKPYRPRFPGPNGRSAILEDFAPGEVALFNDLALSVKDAEMRARLADLSWVLARQHGAAELAITSYLEAAKVLEDPAHPFDAVCRIERALRLAAQLQNRGVALTRLTGRKGQVMLYLPSEAAMLAGFINMDLECSGHIAATSLAARHRRRSRPSATAPKGGNKPANSGSVIVAAIA
jgi:hypothetical protein